jgi:hypothetical protein
MHERRDTRTNSVNCSETCLHKTDTHRTDVGRTVKDTHTVEQHAVCARIQLG